MIKMKIVMDEDKINKDGKYTLEDLYKKITEIIFNKGIVKNTELGIYEGTENKDDFANFGSVILELKNYTWFTKYVKTWIWDVDGEINDIAKFYNLGDVA